MKKLQIILLIVSACVFAFSGITRAQFPEPTAYFNFDEENGNVLHDRSGNENHAWWYNYNQQDPGETERTGWRPNEGLRGGAGYFNGDHVYCGNRCSSGSDIILLARSEVMTCDDDIPVDNGNLKGDMSNFTITFWYKNNFDYFCDPGEGQHVCEEIDTGCTFSRHVLLSMGWDETGLVLETVPGAVFPALIRLTINTEGNEDPVILNAHHPPFYENEWVHYAIVFDGNTESNIGTIKLYLDGELYSTAERNTPFGMVKGHAGAYSFGALMGRSVTQDDIIWECWGDHYPLCGVTPEQDGRLRYGWPVRGWVDDFAQWTEHSLTIEEIMAFDAHIAAMYDDDDDTRVIGHHRIRDFQIAPSFATDHFRIEGVNKNNYHVALYNYLGQKVHRFEHVDDGQILTIPSHIQTGMYLVRIEGAGHHFKTGKLYVINQ